MLWLWIRLDYSICYLLMLILAAFMLFFFVFWSPYTGKMDTIGSICNILLQIFFLLATKLRNEGLIPSSYDNDLIFCLVISIFCCTCFCLSIARVILAICCRE